MGKLAKFIQFSPSTCFRVFLCFRLFKCNLICILVQTLESKDENIESTLEELDLTAIIQETYFFTSTIEGKIVDDQFVFNRRLEVGVDA